MRHLGGSQIYVLLKNEIVNLTYVVRGKGRGGRADIVISQVKLGLKN